MHLGAGLMAQWLRVHHTLAESTNLVSAVHVLWFTATANPSLGV